MGEGPILVTPCRRIPCCFVEVNAHASSIYGRLRADPVLRGICRRPKPPRCPRVRIARPGAFCVGVVLDHRVALACLCRAPRRRGRRAQRLRSSRVRAGILEPTEEPPGWRGVEGRSRGYRGGARRVVSAGQRRVCGSRLLNGSLEIGAVPVLRERTQPLLRVILLFRIALDFDRTFGHHRGDGADRSPYGEEQGSR